MKYFELYWRTFAQFFLIKYLYLDSEVCCKFECDVNPLIIRGIINIKNPIWWLIRHIKDILFKIGNISKNVNQILRFFYVITRLPIIKKWVFLILKLLFTKQYIYKWVNFSKSGFEPWTYWLKPTCFNWIILFKFGRP